MTPSVHGAQAAIRSPLSARRLGGLALLASVLVLAGCGLPRSGPSKSEVMASAVE